MSLLRWYCSKLKPPSEQAKQSWQKIKTRGKKRYVWRVGVLEWGGLTFIAMVAQGLIRTPRFQHHTLYYVGEIAINLLICPSLVTFGASACGTSTRCTSPKRVGRRRPLNESCRETFTLKSRESRLSRTRRCPSPFEGILDPTRLI